MANELRVGVVADASGLGPGLSAATSQVQASAQTMAEAQKIATQATIALAEAQKTLGGAAADGNRSAAAILSQYSAQAAAAAEAVAALGASAATAEPPLKKLADTTDDVDKKTQRMGSSTRIASGLIGASEGHFLSANRSAAAFLTTTLGLGPALQAAFPIIGAIAMGEVLVDIGKNAYEAYEKFVSIDAVWEKLDDDVRKMQGQDFINVHSIETATERLKEAQSAADGLRVTAEAVHKESMGDFVGALLSGNIAGAASAASGLMGAHGAAEGSAAQAKNAIVLQEKQLADQHELNDLKIEAAHSIDSALTGEAKINAEYSKRVALAREEQSYNEQRDRFLGNSTPAAGGDQKASLEIQAAAGQAEAGRIELLRRSHAEYVSEFVEDERRKAEALKASQVTWEDVVRQFDQGQREETEAMKRGEEADRRSSEEFKRRRSEEQSDAREVAQTTIQAANETFSSAERQIRMQEELGQVSHRVATQQILDAERVKESSTQGALGKEAGLFDPLEGGQQEKEYDRLQQQMTQEAQKSTAERQKITDQETQLFIRDWKKAMSAFNSDFTQAFNGVLTKQESMSQAFGKMFGTIELQLADFVLQWLLKQGEMWVETQVMQALGLTTQKATQKAADVATIASDAGVAAAGTMAYYSAINPMIAPAMAAVSFGETMSFAAFEAGGIVGGSHGAPVPIVAHAGERVLSAGQTSNFESMVNSGGNRTAALHQENHFGGGVTEDMLAAHTQSTMAQLRRMLRPEALA